MDKIHEEITTLKETLSLLNKKKTLQKLSSHENIINQLKTLNAFIHDTLTEEIYKKTRKEYKCLKCNETNPIYFYRKVSECTQCINSAAYNNVVKQKLEQGKERNIQARIARGECFDCKLVVTRENSSGFDWDHRDPKLKSFPVSRANYKKDEIFQEEIAKCDLVCKMCHMKRTQYQFDMNIIEKKKSKKEKEKS
jgi:hypothetical protein